MGINCCHEERINYVIELPYEKNWFMKPHKIKYHKINNPLKSFENSNCEVINTSIEILNYNIINNVNTPDNLKIDYDCKNKDNMNCFMKKFMKFSYNSSFIKQENGHYKNQTKEDLIKYVKQANNKKKLTNIESKDRKQNIESSSINYLDPLFPQMLDSINNFKSDIILSHNELKVIQEAVWKRPSEIEKFKNYCLYKKIDLNDVLDGSLKNDYFISSLRAFSAYPYRIERAFFDSKINEHGVYSVKLYIEGVPVIISVDDYFICDENENWVFSYSKSNQIWIQVLEKSWAKLNGSYISLMKGRFYDTIGAINEAPIEYLNHSKFKANKLFRILSFCYRNKYNILSTSIKDPTINQKGIANSQAYAVLGLYESKIEQQSEELKLIKLRNHKRDYSWKGNYSMSDSKWTSDLKKKLEINEDEEGVFYMEFSDFIKYFENTIISLTYDYYKYSYAKLLQKPHDSILITSFEIKEDDYIELDDYSSNNESKQSSNISNNNFKKTKSLQDYLFLVLHGKSNYFYFNKHNAERGYNNKCKYNNNTRQQDTSQNLLKENKLKANDTEIKNNLDTNSDDEKYQVNSKLINYNDYGNEDDFNLLNNHPEIYLDAYDFKSEEEMRTAKEKLKFNTKYNQNLSLILTRFNQKTNKYTYIHSTSIPEEKAFIQIKLNKLSPGEYHVFSHTLINKSESDYDSDLYRLNLSAYSPLTIKFLETKYQDIPEDFLFQILKDYVNKQGQKLSLLNNKSYGYIRNFIIGNISENELTAFTGIDNFKNFNNKTRIINRTHRNIKSETINLDFEENDKDTLNQVELDFIEKYSKSNLEISSSRYIDGKFKLDFICLLFTNTSKCLVAHAVFDSDYIKDSLILLNNKDEMRISIRTIDYCKEFNNESITHIDNDKEYIITNEREVNKITEINDQIFSMNNENIPMKNDYYYENKNITTSIDYSLNGNKNREVILSQKQNSTKEANNKNKTTTSNIDTNNDKSLMYTKQKISFQVQPDSEVMIIYKYNTLDKECKLSVSDLRLYYQNFSKEDMYRLIIDKEIKNSVREQVNECCDYVEIEFFSGIIIVFINNSKDHAYRFKISLEELENLKVSYPKKSPYIFTIYSNKYEFIVMEKIKSEFDIDYDIEYVYKKIH